MITSRLGKRDNSQVIGKSLRNVRYKLFAVIIGSLLILQACTPRIIERGGTTGSATLNDQNYIATDSTTLQLYKWLPETPPRAVVVAVHGMNEYSKAFEIPAKRLRQANIAVYAFDQRGFGASPDRGLWPGTLNLSNDLLGFVRLVKEQNPKVPIFLLGESMGGGVVLVTAARDDLVPLDGIILVAPAICPWDELPLRWRIPLWLMAHSVPWLSLTGRGLNLRPTDNIELLREMSRDKLIIRGTRVDAIYGLTDLMDEASRAAPNIRIPGLVLYGKKDDFVRKWMIASLRDRTSDQHFRFATFEKGYHWLLRDLDSEPVYAEVLDWINGRVAALQDKPEPQRNVFPSEVSVPLAEATRPHPSRAPISALTPSPSDTSMVWAYPE